MVARHDMQPEVPGRADLWGHAPDRGRGNGGDCCLLAGSEPTLGPAVAAHRASHGCDAHRIAPGEGLGAGGGRHIGIQGA